jgi:GTP-binding protein
MTETEPSPHEGRINSEQIAYGAWLFEQTCDFVVGAKDYSIIPSGMSIPEIAFAGRSNVGKSSLINALTRRKTMARTSKTPGRTQQLNFFNLNQQLMLVDLPGYGFAEVSKKEKIAWGRLIRDYLSGRPQLKRVCVLIDSRHGIKALDRDIMKLLDEAAVNYQLILTKCDKSSATTIQAIEQEALTLASHHPAMHPWTLPTSSENLEGIPILRAELASLGLQLP